MPYSLLGLVLPQWLSHSLLQSGLGGCGCMSVPTNEARDFSRWDWRRAPGGRFRS